MNQNNSFKLQTSLKRLSAVVVAVRFWGKPSVKDQIKDYFLRNCCCSHKSTPHDDCWGVIVKSIIRQVDSLDLTSELSVEIKDMVHALGERLFYWEMHVIKTLNCMHDNAENLYWTAIGTLDERKICKLVWLTNPNFPCFQKEIGIFEPTTHYMSKFLAAASYVEENFIRSSLNEVAPVLESFIGLDISNVKLKINSFIAMFLCFHVSKDRFEGLELYRSLKNSNYATAADKLFLISANNLLVRPAEYFYKRLKKNDQQKFLHQAAMDCLGKSDEISSNYKLEKLEEVLLFLINNMSPEKKQSFLVNNVIQVIEILGKIWPYQEVCVPILDCVWDDLSNFTKEALLKNWLDVLVKFILMQCSLVQKTNQQILKYVLGKMSKDLKEKIFVEDKSYWYELFKKSDYSTMLLILNDTDLADKKGEIIQISSKNMLKYLTDGGKFRSIIQYMENLNFSDEEREILKQNYGSLLPGLLKNEKLALADKLLNWCCDSAEEKIKLKQGVDHYSICSKFLSDKNYNLANKFMKWRFDNPEEERKAKKEWIKSTDFLQTEFCKLWTQYCEISLKMAKDKCSEFLHFVFGMEELITFKKGIFIKDENFVKIFCDQLNNEKYFNTIDEIFDFCGVTINKVKEIQTKIKEDLEMWIEIYAVRKHKFLIVDALVKWIFKDKKKEKKNFMEKYFKTDKGGLLIFSVLSTTLVDDSPDKASAILIQEWAKPNANFGTVLHQLMKFDGKMPPQHMHNLFLILDRVQKTGFLG